MFHISKKHHLLHGFIALSIATLSCQTAGATAISVFDYWTQFAADDSIVTPGGGGQAFDAEYLFYKVEGSKLSIGLQTGFNVLAGEQLYDWKTYYAGDLALSFDGNNSAYEYAFDFGFITKDYAGNEVGGQADAMGLYKDIVWNDDGAILYGGSNPFAMDNGTLITGAGGTTDADTFLDSYWRTVTFDLNAFGPGFTFTGLDAHWTMSCGNDAINGSAPAPVPEPATMLLFGTGIAGLAGSRLRKMKK